MKKKLMSFLASMLMGCGQMGPSAPSIPVASPSPTLKPNIIVVNADDLPARMAEFLTGTVLPQSLYRSGEERPSPRVWMPQLHSLMNEGTVFTTAYTAAPVCAPSRACLLTGTHVKTNGVRGNNPPSGGFERFTSLGLDRNTIATMLPPEYVKILAGKWLNGYSGNYRPPGWDKTYILYSLNYIDFYMNENGGDAYFYSGHENYQTNVLPRKVVFEAEAAAVQGKPFFAYVTPTTPHHPIVVAQKHADRFTTQECAAPRLVSFNEDDMSDKAGVFNMRPISSDEIRRIDQRHCAALRAMLSFDDLLGELRAMVERVERQTGRPTIIIVTSDNGFLYGEHRISSSKDMIYDEASRIPFVVWGPGVRKNQVQPHVVSNIDIAPTVLEWSGASIPDHLEGRSLVQVLRGETPIERWRPAVLFEQYEDYRPDSDPLSRVPILQAIRTERYIYGIHAGGAREAYDMRTDPLQVSMLRDFPEKAVHEAHLARLAQCKGASCRN